MVLMISIDKTQTRDHQEKNLLICYISFIKSRKAFGRTVAGACFKTPRTPVCTVEFQKRGLPYCHLLI
jgi:hypothetical protein